MTITYNDTRDLLYIRLDDTVHEVVNRRIDDDIVLDLGPESRIVGIEILNASKRVDIAHLLPVQYQQTA